MIQDPHSVLGVNKDASKDEIKKAYRNMAKKYHPDLHPNDPNAANKMNEINEAYDMLSNPEKYNSNMYSGYNGSYRTNRTDSTGNGYSSGPFGNGPHAHYEYREFNFEDLFGTRNNRRGAIPKPSKKPNDSDMICKVIDLIYANQYVIAVGILNQMTSDARDARWCYISAIANFGAGNELQAQNLIEKAIKLEPGNKEYMEAYMIMRQSNDEYRRAGQPYDRTVDCSPCCLMCCEMWCLYNCCCIC